MKAVKILRYMFIVVLAFLIGYWFIGGYWSGSKEGAILDLMTGLLLFFVFIINNIAAFLQQINEQKYGEISKKITIVSAMMLSLFLLGPMLLQSFSQFK